MIELSKMLAKLRSELFDANAASEGSTIRMLVEEAEIELKLSVQEDAKAEGGLKFYIFNVGGSATSGSTETQTLRLKLKPVVQPPDGGPQQPLPVAATE